MPATNKFKNTLGSLVVSYLSKNSDSKKNNNKNNSSKKQHFNKDYYTLFKTAIKRVVYKVVTQLGLRSVITDHQIDSASSDLLNEIVLSPTKFETIIDRIKSSPDLDEETRNKKIVNINTSKHVSSKIREIAELEEKPAPIIHSYLSKRCITLLKQYAEGNSRKYILLNNNIKKAITSLKEDNLIYEPIRHRYSISQKPTAIYNPEKCSIITNEELETESKKIKHNIKQYILAFLKANYFYNFSARDFTEYAFAMFYEEKPINETATEKDDSGGFSLVGVNSSDISAQTMAEDSMNILIKQATNTESYIQSEMALLAYLYRTVPQYFSSQILTNEQLELEETKCIEIFLNDKRFRNFNKSTIGRTTANNRKKAGINRIKSLLLDLSAEAQGIFIKSCCHYLEDKFNKIIGEKK